jgi:hypothetical protein
MRVLMIAAAALCAAGAALAAKPTPLPKSDEMQVYILLDRTGSMEPIWTEALKSVNAYADELARDQDPLLNVAVTLAVFDAQDGLQFDVLRRKVNPGEWPPVTSAEASPRGMTPLFDAIGEILTIAEKDDAERAVLVVMTDGEENASRELTKEAVRARLDRARNRGWEVVFLGAEFVNFSDASSVGVSAGKSMGVRRDRMEDAMRSLSQKSKAYGAAKDSSAPIQFDDADRAQAQEEDLKPQGSQNRR